MKPALILLAKLPLKGIGWLVGCLSVLIVVLWRRQKLALIGAVFGFVLGSSAGVAFGGTAYNGSAFGAVLGALFGYFLTSSIGKRN